VDLPEPPEEPADLLAWAAAHGLEERLDDLVIGDGLPGTVLPGRDGEALTYRQVLVEHDDPRRHHDAADTARRLLHRMANLACARRDEEAWLQDSGQDPQDEALAALLERLRACLGPVRPAGSYEPVSVTIERTPVPALRYQERPLVGTGLAQVVLPLLGWNEAPLCFREGREEATPEHRDGAARAFIGLMRDPRRAGDHELLADLLRLRPWQYALGALDESLSRLETAPPAPGDERVAFRVKVVGTALDVEPVVQRRGRGGFSKGSRLQWFNLAQRPDLTPTDRRAFLAYDDRFARGERSWGGGLSAAQVFGILRALMDHPAVFLEGEAEEAGRLEVRQARLRLRFATGSDGTLTPQFELAGVTLLPPDVAAALRDDRHLIHLHRPASGPQLLLSELSPQAAAVVRAMALAPAAFPPDAHDALAARLETLQETVDIEFPSRWTRTIGPADARIVVRLDLLASGALAVRFGVRPVKLGPIFPPGEGPVLVLEGQGRERHGARREPQRERQDGHALAERLGLGSGQELEPWRWRVSEGDPALGLVETLAEAGGEVLVEWADDARLTALGTVTRRSLRMKVTDSRDWFDVEGGAEVGGEKVHLSTLLAAIREGRRYVLVKGGGFARIENELREALARAEGAFLERQGTLQIAWVATDPLLGLVEDQAQIAASKAFSALRKRMESAAVAPRLPQALRPYQRAGVEWMARLAHWGAGGLLADEMGLGKTVQTLAMLSHRAGEGPALVVAPTSVVANWVNEAARFAPELQVRLYRGPDRAGALSGCGPGDLVVTSYAIAALDAEALARLDFGTLVLDEAQALKNASSERNRAVRALRAGWRLALTGTPIENHLGELWSLFRVISPGLLGSWEQFRGRYAVPIEKFGDEARRGSLASLIRPFVLRRTKADVAPELPARTEVVRTVRLSPDEEDLYQQLRQATLDELEMPRSERQGDGRDLRMVVLAAITRLRQLCCHPRLVFPHTHAGSAKAAYLLELLGELREGGHRALVFSQFRSFLELLAPRLRQHGFRVLVLDGTTPAELREGRIAAFQNGEADVFLISLKAGGFGLNLTAADTVVHLDPWWNPAVEDQASARAHRIGQEKPVTVVRLVARDTIEESVLGLHAAKRALAAGVLEGSDLAATLDTDALIALIRRGR
jgi:superfamily II DNA or RNA helicase